MKVTGTSAEQTLQAPVTIEARQTTARRRILLLMESFVVLEFTNFRLLLHTHTHTHTPHKHTHTTHKHTPHTHTHARTHMHTHTHTSIDAGILPHQNSAEATISGSELDEWRLAILDNVSFAVIPQPPCASTTRGTHIQLFLKTTQSIVF